MFTLSTCSHSPRCRSQEGRPLTILSPQDFSCFVTLSESLLIQTPSIIWWYRWFPFCELETTRLSDLVSQYAICVAFSNATRAKRVKKSLGNCKFLNAHLTAIALSASIALRSPAGGQNKDGLSWI